MSKLPSGPPTTQGAAAQTAKIHALTSLRFFAAIFVAFHHAKDIYLPGLRTDTFLGKLAQLGYVSVSFFFLLSGYILAVVYLRRGSEVPLRPFFRARFARVYPLFLLTLVLDTPLLYMARWVTFGPRTATLKVGTIFAAKLLMLQAWLPQLRGLDDPNWSLSVETLFYLTFPWIGVALWRLRGRALWLATALIYACGTALSGYAFYHLKGDLNSRMPLLHLSTFGLGILLARWQTLRPGSPRWAPTIAGTAALAGFCAIVWWSPQILNFNLLICSLTPVFVLAIWAFSHPHWLPAKLLSVGWLVALGEASYGLYLFHLPILHWFLYLGWRGGVWTLGLFLAVSVAVSLVSFYRFEAPARRWILKRGQVRVKETLEMASGAQ